jgi:7,8-dihydro-6-hydroxymethylpterin-pyrophosphokinase
MKSHQVILSLGVIRDKLETIQACIVLIHKEIGTVIQVSKSTKRRLGFESDAFITAHWYYIPFIQLKKVLTLALKLEKKLGRVRNSEIGYQSELLILM